MNRAASLAFRYVLALAMLPTVGAATAAGNALGGPILALVIFLVTSLGFGAVLLWPILKGKGL